MNEIINSMANLVKELKPSEEQILMGKIIDKIVEYANELTTISEEEQPRLRLQATILYRKSLNYMNRKDFPQELIGVLAEQLALFSFSQQQVKKVTEGDTTVEYATQDNLFNDIKTQLNKFRKVGTI
ncbi:hypothetical protein [Fusobacterium hominis]|uniref:hypothetical protein n=1 Tax=Fusobacterium hominis TaxID=2764326 RepID=UPI0022DF87A3|nr:hypothetical protein [Fusobacterium hominis]